VGIGEENDVRAKKIPKKRIEDAARKEKRTGKRAQKAPQNPRKFNENGFQYVSSKLGGK